MSSRAHRASRVLMLSEGPYRVTAVESLFAKSQYVLAGWHYPHGPDDLMPAVARGYDAAIVDLGFRFAPRVAEVVMRLWRDLSLSSVVTCHRPEIARIARELGGAPATLLPLPLQRDELLVALRSLALKTHASFSVPSAPTPRVFISYASVDNQASSYRARWLDRVLHHVSGAVDSGEVRCWTDRRLEPGDEWERGIRDALHGVKTAVLLVSANFLGSPYIMKKELPILLARAEQGECRIIPVVLYPCAWQDVRVELAGRHGVVRLGKYQAVARSEPLATLSDRDQAAELQRLARIILEAPPVNAVYPSRIRVQSIP